MIKLFRNSRKEMLAKGRLKRYLTYAIGEILLVVIGILIALSINNWNNLSQLRDTELNVLKNLRSQINEDANVLKSVIDYNDTHRKGYAYAHQLIEANNRQKVDTLSKIIPTIMKYSDFDRSGNIFQNLMNSGDLKLISNATIVRRIQILEEKYLYLNRMEEIHFEAIIEFASGIIHNFNFSNGVIEKPEAIFSFQFQNVLQILIDISDEKDEVYHQALNEISAINKLIDQEYQ